MSTHFHPDAITDWLDWLSLQKSDQTVRKLESERTAMQKEMGPILAKKPLEPTASSLPPKLSAINNKIDDINTLTDLYNKK